MIQDSFIRKSDKVKKGWYGAHRLLHRYYPIQDREQKGPATSFSLVTSTNVRIAPKTFGLLVLVLLPH